MDKKYHYIYKITRFDGKYYIGIHSSNKLNDGYFGSGSYLLKSIRYYGKNKHTKEILEFLSSREELRLKEAILVNEEILKDPLCMNLSIGGKGCYKRSNETCNKISISKRGRIQSQEEKDKRANSLRGQKRTLEHCIKQSIRQLGIKQKTEHAAKSAIARKGLKSTKETINKMKKTRNTDTYKIYASIVRQKPCTIDGIIIYPSRNALVLALGHGKNGSRSSTFRYI